MIVEIEGWRVDGASAMGPGNRTEVTISDAGLEVDCCDNVRSLVTVPLAVVGALVAHHASMLQRKITGVQS